MGGHTIDSGPGPVNLMSKLPATPLALSPSRIPNPWSTLAIADLPRSISDGLPADHQAVALLK
jgi:hypothetical protein